MDRSTIGWSERRLSHRCRSTSGVISTAYDGHDGPERSDAYGGRLAMGDGQGAVPTVSPAPMSYGGQSGMPLMQEHRQKWEARAAVIEDASRQPVKLKKRA